jgi:uncharacterized protein YcbX
MYFVLSSDRIPKPRTGSDLKTLHSLWYFRAYMGRLKAYASRLESDMTCVISDIFRFPIKGLSPERLSRISLVERRGLPGDRQYAFALARSEFDPAVPLHLPKTNFLMLMRDEELAKLATAFDPATLILTIRQDGVEVMSGNLAAPADRARLENFFQEYLRLDARPRLVQAENHMFSDRGEKLVSLQNLASIAEFGNRVGKNVHPIRFRANVHLDGLEPWQEMAWVGRNIRLGGATLQVVDPIRRCAATTVNPDTAERDINVPKLLMEEYGHMNMGIYARVISAGDIASGDSLDVAAA